VRRLYCCLLATETAVMGCIYIYRGLKVDAIISNLVSGFLRSVVLYAVNLSYGIFYHKYSKIKGSDNEPWSSQERR
jgi:hypothetical protein